MKLEHPFIQLPLKFDADRLLKEIEALGESAWQPHPEGFAGNFALTLITPEGINNSDQLAGPMRPTEYLLQCPYLMEVLQTIGGVWGRTRLMKLSGQAEVNAHVDEHYYWRERMRVHVPIITQSSVRFFCGDQEINMAAGECWIFDTWRRHRVVNDAARARIHLVADTVGGEQFLTWLRSGKPAHIKVEGWAPKNVSVQKDALPAIRFETENIPNVMSPWELREHFTFLFNEAIPHPNLDLIANVTFDFCASWHALWVEKGDDESSYRQFRKLRDAYLDNLGQFPDLWLKNGVKFKGAVERSLLLYCVKDERNVLFREIRNSNENDFKNSGNGGEKSEVKGFVAESRLIQRPLIIVSSPRSGSTMFFDALRKCPDIYTIGGESHTTIESISGLHPSAKNYDSNVLGMDDCSPGIAKQLCRKFYLESRKSDDSDPAHSEVIRLLEKTPKNALRIPFMQAVFPDADFIYLHRDPRHVMSSMIDAWQSGRFKTYPELPGWSGLPWSLLLVPSWRNLIGLPLHHVVAHQWATTTKIMLDDLQTIDPGRVERVRYETFVRQPQAEVKRLCASFDLRPTEDLSVLPLSRYTLTPPDPDKWKRNEHLVVEIWPIVEEQVLRAEKFMENTL